MTWRAAWKAETNPETGALLEQFERYMHDAQNGMANIDCFFEAPYGEVLTERLLARFALEKKPGSEEDLAHYRDLGLVKRMFHAEDYYGRYTLLIPDYMLHEHTGSKYPLVFACHGYGNAIENEEYSWGFAEIASQEGFMIALPQNTNWQSVSKILDELQEEYPVDPQRVYIAGYSQGGNQVMTAMMHMPHRLAGAAPGGCDIDRSMDNFGNAFTAEHQAQLREIKVPLIQIVGACERANFVPVNRYDPLVPGKVRCQSYDDPRKDNTKDPTILVVDGIPKPSAKDFPAQDENPHRWKLGRLNHRLWLQGCEPRAVERCMKIEKADGEVQNRLGFYGDRERIETHLGIRHFVSDVHDERGIPMFRMVAMEHGFHSIPVTFGILVWEYFRQFKRDCVTGQLVIDPYSR